MDRHALLLGAAVAGLLVGLAGGCGSAGLPTSAAKAGPTAAQASPEGDVTATPGSAGGGGGGGPTPAATPVTRTPTPRPSSPPTVAPSPGLPEILSFTGVPSKCPAASGTVSVKLTWTSKNANEAWMTNPPVAVAAGDPKSTQGATGPLPPNGSVTMTFDCRSEYGYYDLGVYGGGQSSGEVLQVPRAM